MKKEIKSKITTECHPYDNSKCDEKAYQCGLCVKHFDEFLNDPIDYYEPAISLLETSGDFFPIKKTRY